MIAVLSVHACSAKSPVTLRDPASADHAAPAPLDEEHDALEPGTW
jgi:hypothetical protein